jgi:hypothetical protein
LNWLLSANEHEALRQRLFRNGYEEEQMLLMRHSISTQKAYAFLGLLLGALPPAAIFIRLFGYGLGGVLNEIPPAGGALLFLCAVMNVVCCLAGYAMGSALGQRSFEIERSSWSRNFLLMPLLGAGWGAVTGVAGGFFFFGVGAFYGWALAIPVGSLGFLMFAIVHRAFERGGMIETRHFLAIACGVSAIISAVILGL